MVHKFATKGGLAQALHKKTRHFYDTRIYQTCAITLPLPSGLKRHLRYLFDELVDYRDQIINIIELEMAIIEERPKNVNIIAAFFLAQLVIITNFDNPCAEHELERLAPRLLEWYQCIGDTKVALSRSVQERINDYGRSRSIFDRTPKEAIRIFKSESRHHSRLRRIPPGAIQVNFYSAYEKGKYGPADHDPDFTICLFVDYARGVYLRELRENLGIESVAIITDKAPFRTVFESTNEDWLSPMAIWDLTKQCTRPLRVFEHRVSHSTKAKRFIREPIYLAFMFILTLLKLMFGYPEKNTVYMGALYGHRYAKIYESIGHITTNLNTVALRGTRLLFQGAMACCIVPFMALYAVLFFVVRIVQTVVLSTFNAARTTLSSVALTASTGAASAFSFAAALNTRGWFIVLGMLWFGLAEYCSFT